MIAPLPGAVRTEGEKDSMDKKTSIWFTQVRGPFLILSVLLVMIGIAAAGRDGHTHAFHSVLLVVGVVLAHASVNLFNELSDHRTGIDSETFRTPFSGGSGMMLAGKTSEKSVKRAAYGFFGLAACIGLYFVFTAGWPVLVFMVLGGIAIRFYTSHLARWLLGEFVAGLTLGCFVVIGSYYVLAGVIPAPILAVSIPPGLLTFLLLFLNEFPDMEADRKGGRHHLVIHLGRKKSARVYAAVLCLTYALILLTPLICRLPPSIYAGLLTIPVGMLAAVKVLRYHDDRAKLLSAQMMNTIVVLATDLLLAAGFII